MQALPAAPESLCVVEMGGTEGTDGEPGLQGSLYLNIGLQVSVTRGESAPLPLGSRHDMFGLVETACVSTIEYACLIKGTIPPSKK